MTNILEEELKQKKIEKLEAEEKELRRKQMLIEGIDPDAPNAWDQHEEATGVLLKGLSSKNELERRRAEKESARKSKEGYMEILKRLSEIKHELFDLDPVGHYSVKVVAEKNRKPGKKLFEEEKEALKKEGITLI